MLLESVFFNKLIQQSLEEDGFYNNYNYVQNLPRKNVIARLKFKSDMTVAGLPVFFHFFNYFLDEKIDAGEYLSLEGETISPREVVFTVPFDIGLTLERTALNLLTRMSSIATTTRKLKSLLKNDIAILDTRKTTPGLRALEKYAVRVGGGHNHRFTQTDVFMIKDNHKTVFGGLEKAIQFFRDQKLFYNSMTVEIHSLQELEQALELGVEHLMLDNFSDIDIDKALEMKKEGVTYEVSGGVNFDNISKYDKEGIDAISVGMITQNPQRVDISLKLGA